MTLQKKIISVLIAFILIGVPITLVLLPRFFQPSFLKEEALILIEDFIQGDIAYKDAQFQYFPYIALNLKAPDLKLKQYETLKFEAEKIQLRFDFWKLLFRRIEVTMARFENGHIHMIPSARLFLKDVELSNVNLIFKPSHGQKAAIVRLEADLWGVPKSVMGKWEIKGKPDQKWNWKDYEFNGNLNFENFPLQAIENHVKKIETGISVQAGNATMLVNTYKKEKEPWIYIVPTASIQGFVYKLQEESTVLTSPVAEGQLNFELGWNMESEEIMIRRSSLKSPFGSIQLSGKWSYATGEIQETRLTAQDLVLENVPQYLLFLKDAIPLNLGFSGASHLEMSFGGTVDHLSLHGNYDLTPTLLAYSRYFSKPKDVSLNLVFDLLLKQGKVLSGDFSTRMQDAALKGSLKDFNILTKEGQVNLITNKFKLAGWQNYLPPVQSYDLAGEIKILANWEGNLSRLSHAKPMLNLTIENARLLQADGEGIKNLFVQLDSGPLSFELKRASFEIAENAVELSAFFYPRLENSLFKTTIQSKRIFPGKFLETLELLGQEWYPEEWLTGLKQTQAVINHFLPSQEPVQDLSFEFLISYPKWEFRKLKFKILEGEIQANGNGDYEGPLKPYQFELDANRLNLARYFAAKGETASPLAGSLFVRGSYSGEGGAPLDSGSQFRGEGVFNITNGEFATIDLLHPLAKIDELKVLGEGPATSVRFHDLRAEFNVQGNKTNTSKLVLISDDFTAEGNGDFNWNRVLNYRLGIYLSPELTRKIFAKRFGDSALRGEKQFGPIPVLISGDLNKPEIIPDPALIPTLLEDIVSNRSYKVLRNFAEEDLFFERRKTN